MKFTAALLYQSSVETQKLLNFPEATCQDHRLQVRLGTETTANWRSRFNMLKSDKWIVEQSTTHGMIAPFEPRMVRFDESRSLGLLSYGTGSYGYDIRLSASDFRIFRHVPGTVVDPKNFNIANLESAKLRHDANGDFFVLPAHSYGLGVAVEKLSVPRNITVVCLGKSTYARLGIIANTTPAEAAWEGHLTLEFSNASSADCRLYVNEGICQLLFFEGEDCQISYKDRRGKYQNQPEFVTFARV
jgi:dCTP deaminase